VAAAELREARTQSILAAPDLVVRTGFMAGGGRVTVASSAAQGASVVSLRADRPPAPGRAFQLWTIGTGNPVSVGELIPAGEASAVQIVNGVPGNAVFAVSEEPAGGSAQPTNVLVKVQLT